jgi:hypothetical protein
VASLKFTIGRQILRNRPGIATHEANSIDPGWNLGEEKIFLDTQTAAFVLVIPEV